MRPASARKNGITAKKIKIIHPQNPKLIVEDIFLLIPEQAITVLGPKIVKQLKLEPAFDKSFSLADGRVIKRKIANVFLEVDGKKVANPVVLGQRGDANLLGSFTPLESPAPCPVRSSIF